MFQPRAALQSSGASGSTVHAPRKRLMAAMFVARSGRLASGAFSRKPGPVGPGDQHRSVQAQLIDDRGEVVRPQLRIATEPNQPVRARAIGSRA
ncbi:hypothetical protein EV644_104542 [Kribbella orskensis]|uniref:Uncharacterized protein n=1 Tax=Kribbella orskensis TaxID=2512216 RepID=A0ABY2BNP5_9ACTN|nr:hypothetical protein EV642_103542 [Kribbella sp. VKM Ac-2500]TCO26038.1 hypothetical protein EV644_104542 [Kribbella orskensis]